MLDRNDIHNSAILRPQLAKCLSLVQTGKHAYAKDRSTGIEQCVDCGRLKNRSKQR